MPRQSIEELKRLLKEAEAERAEAKRNVGVEIRQYLEGHLADYLADKYPDHTYLSLADIFTASAKRYEVDGVAWNGMRPYPLGFISRVTILKQGGMKEDAAKRKAKAEFEIVEEAPQEQPAPPPPPRDQRRGQPINNRRH